ncbi:MAG: hypothetical protein C0621_08095 [Desulfuromonas sp.]|nr:MAG: hypothetical protein C0621_08095 [Desulfuromonas sp.]
MSLPLFRLGSYDAFRDNGNLIFSLFEKTMTTDDLSSSSPSRREVLLMLISGLLVVLAALGFGRFSMALILPSMQDGLALSHARMGMLVTAAFSGYLAFSIGAGIAAARWGASRVVVVSLFVTASAMMLTGLSHGFWSPLFLLALSGVGIAGANVPVMAMINAWVPAQRRGVAAGILCSGGGVGLVLNGWLLPPVLAWQGWRGAWLVLGGIVLVIACWSALVLRDAPWRPRARVLSGREILTEIWALLRRHAALRKLALVYFAFGFSYVIFTTFFGSYLVETRGWTTQEAGRLWSWVGLCSLPSASFWGAVSDRIGRHRGLCIIYTLHGLCLSAFAALPWDGGIIAAALIYGFSIFSVPAIVSAACGDALPQPLIPLALGGVTVVFGSGQMAAPAVAGLMLDQGWGMVENLWLSALVAFAGAVGALFLKERQELGSVPN